VRAILIPIIAVLFAGLIAILVLSQWS
jgi:hypothetical protein